jgi:hypothetical protein
VDLTKANRQRYMLMEDEVVMLLMGIGVFVFLILNRFYLRKIRFWKILLAGYLVLLTGWLFTVLEGFLLEKYLNVLEHTSYTLGSILFIVWSWKFSGRARKEDKQ